MAVRILCKEVTDPIIGIVPGWTIDVSADRREEFVPTSHVLADNRHDHVRGNRFRPLADTKVGSVGEPIDPTSSLVQNESETQAVCVEGVRAFDIGHPQKRDIGVNVHVPIMEYASANREYQP